MGIALATVSVLGTTAAIGVYLWLRVPPTDASPEQAIARFQAVLNGALDDEDAALSALAGALEREPDAPQAQLWFGLANLHGYIRHRELPYAIRAMRALERAVELAPDDRSAEGWRAFFAYQAARNRDEDLGPVTVALLDAAEADPRFTSFLAAVALAKRPLASGLPQQLLVPLEAAGECGDGTSWRCRTSALFPHGAEGYHATLGDLRLRLGDLEGARASYRRALAMPSAASWPYRDAFTAWAERAEERMGQLRDEENEGDPQIFFASGERACAACHQR